MLLNFIGLCKPWTYYHQSIPSIIAKQDKHIFWKYSLPLKSSFLAHVLTGIKKVCWCGWCPTDAEPRTLCNNTQTSVAAHRVLQRCRFPCKDPHCNPCSALLTSVMMAFLISSILTLVTILNIFASDNFLMLRQVRNLVDLEKCSFILTQAKWTVLAFLANCNSLWWTWTLN